MKLIEIANKLPVESGMTNVHCYKTDNGMTVIYSEDITPKWGKLKHISIAHPKKLPCWDNIFKIKEKLMGDIDAMMVMPKMEDYINLHRYCFHIWECPEKWELR